MAEQKRVRYLFTKAGSFDRHVTGGTIQIGPVPARLWAPEGEFKGDGVQVIGTPVAEKVAATKRK